MIQRKQTLWLLLSTISSALTFKFPFYIGIVAPDTTGVEGPELTATDNIYLILLTVAVAALSAVTIFLFKDRKKQIRFSLIGLLCSIGLMVVYFMYIKNFSQGTFALTSVLTLLIIIGFFFAIRGIRHDQKLIKDLNRLR
ncbi:DUF4293 domain-containing protein [Niabella aquatica]